MTTREYCTGRGAKAVMAAMLLLLPLAPVSAQVVEPSNLDHLKCYRIQDSIQPAHYLADLRNQFGLEPGCVIMTPARAMCVETEKRIISSPSPPGGGPSGEAAGHFLCYTVRCPTTAVPSTVAVEDQFGRRLVTVDNARLLCAPVNKLICGDGEIDPGETCDPGSAATNVCPGGVPCGADCTCPPGVCCQCPDSCTIADGTICPSGCSPVAGGVCSDTGVCETCPCGQTCVDDSGTVGICREPATGGPCECVVQQPDCVCGDPCQTRQGPGHCRPTDDSSICECRPDEPPDCPCGAVCTLRNGVVGTCRADDGSTECKCRPQSDCPCGETCENSNGEQGVCRHLPGTPEGVCTCFVPPVSDCPCGANCVATTGVVGKCRPVPGVPGVCSCVPPPPPPACQCGKPCVGDDGSAGRCRPVRGSPGTCACVSG